MTFSKKCLNKVVLKVVILATIILQCTGCGSTLEYNFKEITGRELTSNVKILYHITSSSDFHGDYGSYIKTEVNNQFNDSLKSSLINRGYKVSNNEPRIKEFGVETVTHFQNEEVKTQYEYWGNSVYYYVGFLADNKSLILIRSSW